MTRGQREDRSSSFVRLRREATHGLLRVRGRHVAELRSELAGIEEQPVVGVRGLVVIGDRQEVKSRSVSGLEGSSQIRLLREGANVVGEV